MVAHRRLGQAERLVVFGVVQGVGFRPFVYRLAHTLGLKGWVANAGFGVEIHIEGPSGKELARFVTELRKSPPPLARIEKIEASPATFSGCRDFEIRKTKEGGGFVFISPDIATCADCRHEIRTAAERRYRYPFTNCTNCGPRYTIVQRLPYDRPRTTMSGFPMCADCRAEYSNPLDRRYHAQPIACPVCGPHVTLQNAGSGKTLAGGIPEAAGLIAKGKVVAVKGLGGFHLVCDPFNRSAVRRLRRTKSRRTKPLALMARDMALVERFALVSPAERQLLLSERRPIVLLKKKPGAEIPLIAPNLDEVGCMFPYTPLHELLLEDLGLIVATSSNNKDAPIIKDEAEGIRGLADYVLTHNRPIAMRADDSVVKVASDRTLFVRRARGYVPYPQAVPEDLRSGRSLVALGGELKDTISIYKDGYVVTSQFLGDLDDYRNLGYFEETLDHLLRLFSVSPEAVVTDLHPDFRTTRYAEKMGLPHYRIQHHYAHVLAPLLEHGIVPDRKVLGVALDGYGYGPDGAAWGGEFLLADYETFERFAHFKSVALPGGDLAAREPWRMALSYLYDAYGRKLPSLDVFRKIEPARRKTVLAMVSGEIPSPPTSSCGRLFDAVSFLCGTAPARMEYEAEAAMRFEAAAKGGPGSPYPVSIAKHQPDGPVEISFAPLIKAVVADLGNGVPSPRVSARFHGTLAQLVLRIAERARAEQGVDTVVLAGGVFLNRRLLEGTERQLAAKTFRVVRPVLYSPNDESLSLGQIAWGLARFKREGA